MLDFDDSEKCCTLKILIADTLLIAVGDRNSARRWLIILLSIRIGAARISDLRGRAICCYRAFSKASVGRFRARTRRAEGRVVLLLLTVRCAIDMN